MESSNTINTGAIIKNIGANTVTVLLIMLFQLLSVPMFLHFWGVQMYGEWIVLYSLNSFFQMSDIGVNTATSNEFTFNYQKNKIDLCNLLLSNNAIFIFITFSVLFVITAVLILLNIPIKILKPFIISHTEINVGVAMMVLQIFIGTYNNMLNTIYKATKRYSRGIMIDNVIRFFEYAAILTTIVLTKNVIMIFILIVIIKIAGIIYKYEDSKRFYNIVITIKHFNIEVIKKMISPSLSFFSVPIANTFVFQGYNMIVNYYLGSTAVVGFATVRTMTNFVKNIINIIHKAVWPEMSIAYGNQQYNTLKYMNRYNIAISFVLATTVAIFIFSIGPYIYVKWTGNKIILDYTLFILFIITIITNSLWSSAGLIMQATNTHMKMSLLYVTMTIISTIVVYYCLKYTRETSWLPITVLIMDAVMIWYTLKYSFNNNTVYAVDDITKKVFK